MYLGFKFKISFLKLVQIMIIVIFLLSWVSKLTFMYLD